MEKMPSLIKPNLNTKFRIDFDWWKAQDQNWRNALSSYLCSEHQQKFSEFSEDTPLDIVDPRTGEVTRGDGLLYILINHCAKQPGFLSESAPLVDSIFKIFLVNQNHPLNAEELSKMIGKPADTILRTIGTGRVYKGIRPL